MSAYGLKYVASDDFRLFQSRQLDQVEAFTAAADRRVQDALDRAVDCTTKRGAEYCMAQARRAARDRDKWKRMRARLARRLA